LQGDVLGIGWRVNKMEPLTIEIKPLTPIWTGDANRECKTLKESGIIGSLRWWYEAILRGMGIYACGPTTNDRCTYEKSDKKSVCLACQLFGCTGLSRKFKLEIIKGKCHGNFGNVKINKGSRNHRGWMIPTSLNDNIVLRITPFRDNGFNDFEVTSLVYLFKFIEKYGAIGSKTAYGQGIFKITEIDSANILPFDQWRDTLKKMQKKNSKNNVGTAIDKFISAEVYIERSSTTKNSWWDDIPLDYSNFSIASNPQFIPSSPAIRYYLRSLLRNNRTFGVDWKKLQSERHNLMGVIGRNSRGSRIFVSHLYHEDPDDDWKMRIFGFLDEKGNRIEQRIRSYITDEPKLKGLIETALSLKVNHVNIQISWETLFEKLEGE
jgi:CRISPR-associated protein Cmr1